VFGNLVNLRHELCAREHCNGQTEKVEEEKNIDDRGHRVTETNDAEGSHNQKEQTPKLSCGQKEGAKDDVVELIEESDEAIDGNRVSIFPSFH